MEVDDGPSDVHTNIASNPGLHADESVDFPPADNDRSSSSSMELVRRAPVETNYFDDEASCETPDDQKVPPSSLKRMASTSGKRGADSQRMKRNEYPTQQPQDHLDDENGIDFSRRFERLSISPFSSSSPPKTIFGASQSPISPRLTYHSPEDENDDSNSYVDEDVRISMGRESGIESHPDISHDTMDTNTPPRRYRDKEKSRAFREVPVNVALKDGATFHLDKLPVKYSDQTNTRSTRNKNISTTALQHRRHVNFPDPFVRYGSRHRRALKEIYSLVGRAEIDFEEGKCGIPAIGVFFSLSEQQIIDVTMKLLLKESSVTGMSSRPPRTKTLHGNTLVVSRSKEDTNVWESALRECTACSVLNHSTLPLSERIRASSAERACAHDVVLTTFDAMKSPDIAVPLTQDGRAILAKTGNERSWHSSRSASQRNSHPQLTKQLSILHRIHFRRIIFVDVLGRKCYLAKGETARASAAIALSGDTRVVFFRESEADGPNPLKTLRKIDKKAFHSVSSVLHLFDRNGAQGDNSDDETESETETTLESIAMNFKDMC
jgi:hypothetical protein